MRHLPNWTRLLASFVLAAFLAQGLAAQDAPPTEPPAPPTDPAPPPAPAPAPEAPKPQADEPAPDQHDPEAMAILARYIEAIGGEEALRKHKHRTIHGEVSQRNADVRGPLTMHLSAPNRLLVIYGEARQGYDGKVAWALDPERGPMLFEGEQAVDMQRQADFYGELHYKKTYRVIEYVGRERFGPEDALRIRLIDRHNKETHAFFDAESNLYIGVMTKMIPETGQMPMMTVVSEYREFDGVKMPTLTRIHWSGDVITMKVESLDHEEIPDSVYELPGPVKALIAKKEKKEEDRDGALGEGDGRP